MIWTRCCCMNKNESANKEKNFISAVIYVRNAEDHIADFLSQIIQLLESCFEHSEIICVNDFSTDGSVSEIKKISRSAQTAAVSILNMSYFHGVEIAMNAGVDLSIGDFVLELDTTVQDYDLDEIMKVYRKVLEGYDIVSASSDRRQKLTSSLFYWVYEKFSDHNKKMHSETFRVLSRRALNRVSSMNRTIPYRKGIYVNCGLQTMNTQYHSIPDRIQDRGDKNLRKYRSSLAVDTLLLFTDAGYFCSKLMTGLMMFLSVFMIIYTVAVYAMAKPVAGWTTTILFLAVAFLGLFIILTIIIKYLQILLKLSFRRTKYSFESIEKLT